MLIVRLARAGCLSGVRAETSLASGSGASRGVVRFKSDATGSTVDRGTRFENGTLLYLSNKFPTMHLIRTGGANDGGIDLLGWWNVSKDSSSRKETIIDAYDRVRVVVQCKAEAKKLGPIHVRELRGVVNNTRTKEVPVLAVLASSSGFSKQCLLQGLSCDFPLLFLHLIAPTSNQEEDVPPACLSILPNEALSQKLLEGRMEIRHLTSLDASGQKMTLPAVYMNGKRL